MFLQCKGGKLCANHCEEQCDDNDTDSEWSADEAFDDGLRYDLNAGTFESIVPLPPVEKVGCLDSVGTNGVNTMRKAYEVSASELALSERRGKNLIDNASFKCITVQPTASAVEASRRALSDNQRAQVALHGTNYNDVRRSQVARDVSPCWSPREAPHACSSEAHHVCERSASPVRQQDCHEHQSRTGGGIGRRSPPPCGRSREDIVKGVAANRNANDGLRQPHEEARLSPSSAMNRESFNAKPKAHPPSEMYAYETHSTLGASSTDGTRTPFSDQPASAPGSHAPDRGTSRSLSAGDRRKLRQMMREQLEEARNVDQTIAQALREVDRRLT